MSGFREVDFQPGEVLFKVGSPADTLYVVQSGTIDMVASEGGGVIATVGPGESFGEQALLQGGIRSATAVAREAARCLEITGQGLRDMLRAQSPLLTPVFEALLLQQAMHNALRTAP